MSRRMPWQYRDRAWPEIAQIREKVETQGDVLPRSELDRPYFRGNDEDDSYLIWEINNPWPGPCPPYCGPIDIPPGPGPCDNQDNCGFVNFADFPETLECEEEFHFRTLHEVNGCQPANFEDQFLVWEVSAGTILSQTPPGMRYKAPEAAGGDTVNIRVSSIDGSCSEQRTFTLECDCCASFTISGLDTVSRFSTWEGTISPACPGASAAVTSNSGCTTLTAIVNAPGSAVEVTPGAGTCGSFKVTVSDAGTGCQEVASKTVRILQDGDWEPITGDTDTSWCWLLDAYKGTSLGSRPRCGSLANSCCDIADFITQGGSTLVSRCFEDDIAFGGFFGDPPSGFMESCCCDVFPNCSESVTNRSCVTPPCYTDVGWDCEGGFTNLPFTLTGYKVFEWKCTCAD